jgi:hypothetical protein
MPHLGPIKRKDLIYYLKLLDFEGPYPGGNHQYVVKVKENIILRLPNPHRGDIRRGFAEKTIETGENRQSHLGKAVGSHYEIVFAMVSASRSRDGTPTVWDPCGTLSGGQVCPRSSSLNSLTIS